MNFRSPSGLILDINGVIESFHREVEDNPLQEYNLVLGTDSLTRGPGFIFVTVLILHRVGKGGRFFFNTKRDNDKSFKVVHSRIIAETGRTVKVLDKLTKSILFNSVNKIEVHIDAGKSTDKVYRKSETAVDSCVGWIKGTYGIEPQVKPRAWAASHVADKYTRR